MVFTKSDADLVMHSFVAAMAVALKLAPMQTRYNAMPLRPGWVVAGNAVIWVWNLFFTSIPYVCWMWTVQLVHRWRLRATGSEKQAADTSESLLNAGRFFAFFTHALGQYLFLAVVFCIYVPEVVSIANPMNSWTSSY